MLDLIEADAGMLGHSICEALRRMVRLAVLTAVALSLALPNG